MPQRREPGGFPAPSMVIKALATLVTTAPDAILEGGSTG